jgi:hypothetical protein
LTPLVRIENDLGAESLRADSALTKTNDSPSVEITIGKYIISNHVPGVLDSGLSKHYGIVRVLRRENLG